MKKLKITDDLILDFNACSSNKKIKSTFILKKSKLLKFLVLYGSDSKLKSLIIKKIRSIKKNECKIILIDDIEKNCHTGSLLNLIDYINDNTSNDQFVIFTNNTHLLSLDLFRKDQIYFYEKENEVFKLYSLFDFKDFPNNMDIGKAYLQGRFGGNISCNLY